MNLEATLKNIEIYVKYVQKSWWEFKSPEDDEFKQCWALCNLQPMWATDNIRKNNKHCGGNN